jgi:hypothetical protein
MISVNYHASLNSNLSTALNVSFDPMHVAGCDVRDPLTVIFPWL